MKKKTHLKKLEELINHEGQGHLKLSVKIDDDMKHLMSNSMHNYFDLPIEAQLVVKLSHSMAGKMAGKIPHKMGKFHGFVFQMSHGTQQVKKYEPEKYKNGIRSRKIMNMAMQECLPNVKTRMLQLFHDYPYNLLKTEAVNLRMKNFYFRNGILPDDLLKIYKAADPEHPNPNTDELYIVKQYKRNRTITFKFTEQDQEHYYAINLRSGETSNVLHFIWHDHLETD